MCIPVTDVLSLAARLHRCRGNCCRDIDNGKTFSGQTSYSHTGSYYWPSDNKTPPIISVSELALVLGINLDPIGKTLTVAE